ncbi:CDK-activating kinase assembly factor MAT1 [Balamuthia mandrillaris]
MMKAVSSGSSSSFAQSASSDRCPICLNDAYLNPTMKLMLSVCQHRFCETCINRIFSTQSILVCPVCNAPLRKTSFVTQSWEDRAMEKESAIRKRILREYNKRPEDFPTLKDYNDYLEEVEDIIFNLANNIDVDATNAKIQRYREENQDLIIRNQSKKAEEDRKLATLLAEEERGHLNRQQTYLEEEQRALEERRKRREQLLDGLAKGTLTPAQLKAEEEKQKQKEKEKERKEEHQRNINKRQRNATGATVTLPEATPVALPPPSRPTPAATNFSYVPQNFHPTFVQPKPVLAAAARSFASSSAAAASSTTVPLSPASMQARKQKEVKAARAGGFRPDIPKKRALEEAFAGLFLSSSSSSASSS